MKNLLAQIELYDKTEGNLKGFGPLGLEQNQQALPVFIQLISSSIGLISLIGIIWFIFIVITGALGIISSGGDKQALEGSKKKISNGVIGIVVIVFGLILVKFIGSLIGFKDILDFEVMFNTLQIQ